MRINSKILSIPPYLSTGWHNIAALHKEDRNFTSFLIVTLINGTRIEVPGLELPIILAIFSAHAKYHMDQEQISGGPKEIPQLNEQEIGGLIENDPFSGMGLPLKIGSGGLESLGAAMQHNSDQANTPDLPKEMLNKIGAIAKAVGIDDSAILPQAEPHCNCMHCQIARAIHSSISGEETVEPAQKEEEEEVSPEDLKFRLWDIDQTAEKLYIVSNPLDEKEHYSVYLGEPLGCTCGEKNCEHIKAVLNS